jgi:20S proteasome alpha/beta subunit
VTIALAILCVDGVVLASDSMGSSRHIATSIRKVRVAESLGATWATTGSEFLDQAVGQAIQGLDPAAVNSPIDIANAIRPVIQSALGQPLPPSDGSASPHHVECLIAAWTATGPALVHLPADLALINCVDKSFVATGSGNEFAHVVFATLSHLAESEITVAQAKLLAYRIINTVCSVSSWGVALPVQISTITEVAGPTIVTGQELDQLNAEVAGWLAFEASQFESPAFSDADVVPLPGASDTEEDAG